jgi:hypothetical protein
MTWPTDVRVFDLWPLATANVCDHAARAGRRATCGRVAAGRPARARGRRRPRPSRLWRRGPPAPVARPGISSTSAPNRPPLAPQALKQFLRHSGHRSTWMSPSYRQPPATIQEPVCCHRVGVELGPRHLADSSPRGDSGRDAGGLWSDLRHVAVFVGDDRVRGAAADPGDGLPGSICAAHSFYRSTTWAGS